MPQLHWIYRAKFWLLYRSGTSFCIIFSLLGLMLSIDYCSRNLGIFKDGKGVDYKFIGFVATFFLFYFNFRSRSLMNLFAVLAEFNKRYDKLNDELANDWIKKEVIIDYFNLCAEEYYFFTHGLIPQDVWDTWYGGMKDLFQNEKVQKEASVEFNDKGKRTYYGFDPYKFQLIEKRSQDV